MKKRQIIIGILVLIIIGLSIFLLIRNKKYNLSDYLDELGENVTISLINEEEVVTYPLMQDEKVTQQILTKLRKIKFTYYPNDIMVEKIIGQFSIKIEGEYTIIINEGYILIDNKVKTVKKYYPEDIIDQLIDELIANFDDVPVYDGCC